MTYRLMAEVDAAEPWQALRVRIGREAYTLAWNGDRLARCRDLIAISHDFPEHLEALSDYLESAHASCSIFHSRCSNLLTLAALTTPSHVVGEGSESKQARSSGREAEARAGKLEQSLPEPRQ